jgi:acyl-CoA dehydrogenase
MDSSAYDDETQKAFIRLRDFFEDKGHAQMRADHMRRDWYHDFEQFLQETGIFARFGTPAGVGALIGSESSWNTASNNDLSELLAYYSLDHWYAWQVTVLGLGPVWMSGNEQAKAEVAMLLAAGGLFGFGLSEQTRGADIYQTDMVLTGDPERPGHWLATGPKYYIGNGNAAARLSVFGRFADGDQAGEYAFFLVDPSLDQFTLHKNVVDGQMYVASFELAGYPVGPGDILHVGQPAWDAALGTVNVGKVQLAWASIGICEHSFVEAVAHAHNR